MVAAPIFRDFMKEALKDKPDIPFRVPPGVKLVRVNYNTGKPAKPGDKLIITEAFRKDTDIRKDAPVIGEIEVGEEVIAPSTQDDIPDVGGLY